MLNNSTTMGSFANVDLLCRLCGTESQDLIYLFDNSSGNRNLVAIIKKYIRVTVSLRDALPHQVCGPCVAKLDEVVDFVDTSLATQTKIKKLLKDNSSDNSGKVNEDHMYELIQDVKVELEETDNHAVADDDFSDEVSELQPHRRRTVKTRAMKGRKENPKGVFGKPARQTKKAKAVRGGSSSKPEVNEVQENEDAASSSTIENTSRTEGKPKCPVRCCVCEAVFNSPEELVAHASQVHHLSEIRYMCSECPRTFVKISSMNSHQRKKHQDSLQCCPKCKKFYPSHYLWTRHMLVHTNTRPFSCDECDKKFKSKAELYNHKRTHKPSEERYTHCCELCGKRFTQKANLESHLRLHSGNRPFSCEFCGKSFSQRGNMEEHRRIHTGEKPFVCDVCGVKYSRQGQLAVHRRKHTGEKPHKCQYCFKEFLRKEVLRKHEHIHTDTRPYKCSFCNKSFRDQGKRKVHERLHTGERPFECHFCNRTFCESGNLKKHLRVHTRFNTSEPAIQGANAQASTVSATSIITTGDGPSHSINTGSSTLACSSGCVSNQSLLLVPDSVAFHGQDSSHLSSNQIATNDSSSPLQMSATVGESTLITHRSVVEATSSEGGEREEDYRVTSSVPFQSVAWALYQT